MQRKQSMTALALTLTLGSAIMLASAPVMAQTEGGGDQSMQSMPGMSGDQGTSAGAMGQHAMSGKVTMINHHSGLIHVKTAEGLMVIHFPPKSLAKVKKGEKIQLHLSFTPEQ